MAYVTSKASALGRVCRGLLAGKSGAPTSPCMLSVVELGCTEVPATACGVSLVEPATVNGTHGLCPEGVAGARPSVSVNAAHICRRLAVHNRTWPADGSVAAATIDAFIEEAFPAMTAGGSAYASALEAAASAPAYAALAGAGGRELTAPELYAGALAAAAGAKLGAHAAKLADAAVAQLARYGV